MVAQGGAVTTFTRDAAGRRLGQSTTGWAQTPQDASAVGELVRHYGDDSDNPAWMTFEGGTERYLPGLGGDLGLQMTTRGQTAEAELSVTNPHGDVVTTIPLGDGNTVTGIRAWSDYTEYGTPRTPATTGQVHGVTGYGWLGGRERATPAGTFGLTLMGARLYNPVTGRFTTTDPVYGGNPNTYTYPTDPINMTDLTGQWRAKKWRTTRWERIRGWAGRKRSSVSRRFRSYRSRAWNWTERRHFSFTGCAMFCVGVGLDGGRPILSWGGVGVGGSFSAHNKPLYRRKRHTKEMFLSGGIFSLSWNVDKKLRSWRPDTKSYERGALWGFGAQRTYKW